MSVWQNSSLGNPQYLHSEEERETRDYLEEYFRSLADANLLVNLIFDYTRGSDYIDVHADTSWLEADSGREFMIQDRIAEDWTQYCAEVTRLSVDDDDDGDSEKYYTELTAS